MTTSSGRGGGASAAGGSASDIQERAGEVAGTAKDEGRHVAEAAKEETGNVAQEAKAQARDLVGELKSQATEQSRSQRDRLAQLVQQVSDELEEMAQSGNGSGMAGQVARQVADRGRRIGSFLEQHEPAELVQEVQGLARRRPGMFLLGAAAAGVLTGRITRGAAAAHGVGGGPAGAASGGDTTRVYPPTEAPPDTGVTGTAPAVDTDPAYGAVPLPTGSPGATRAGAVRPEGAP